MNDPQGPKELANLLAACFDIFPLYGREPEAMVNINRAFRISLADYPVDAIQRAFSAHLRASREFPLPADIIHLIERKGKPAFQKPVYIAISAKRGEDRTKAEWEYLREYEQYHITGKH